MNTRHSLLRLIYRLTAVVLTVVFSLTSLIWPVRSYAATLPQGLAALPTPGTRVGLSEKFSPTIVRGLTIYPNNPLQFDFIVDTGDNNLEGQAFEDESKRLIKYFLASLTVPEDELWVNLSPYEKNRIIPEGLSVTELGVDMLAQDYLLKQLTASMLYPEETLGAKFWQRVRQKAKELYGTTNIPVNTFNKVWIVPDKAGVYEHENSVFVVERHLKVMLEHDYLAAQEGNLSMGGLPAARLPARQGRQGQGEGASSNDQTQFANEIIREIIIPEIEKEVNEGKNFARLRQIYNSMILATWYKKRLRESLLGQVYADKNKTKGVDVDDRSTKEKLYEQYLAAFKKGVYNYIKKDVDEATGKPIPRKYFSGGLGVGVVTAEKLKTYTGDVSRLPKSLSSAARNPESKGRDQRVQVALMENAAPSVEPQATAFLKNPSAPQNYTDKSPRNSFPSSQANTIARYIADLRSHDVQTIVSAAEKLGELGDIEAIQPLLQLLSDSRPVVQQAAEQAVKKLGATKSQLVHGYCAVLAGNHWWSAHLNAIEKLGQLGDRSVVNLLLVKLSDGIKPVRQATEEALKKLGASDEQRLSGYVAALDSNSWEARQHAAKKLAEFEGGQRAVKLLLPKLSTNNKDVIEPVERLLKKFGASDEQMVDGYIFAVASRTWMTVAARDNAANKLGESGDKRAVKPLLEKLGTDISESVEKALKKLDVSEGQIVDAYISALAVGTNEHMWIIAAKRLGELGDKRAVKSLLTRLGYDNYALKAAVEDALKKLNAQSSVSRDRQSASSPTEMDLDKKTLDELRYDQKRFMELKEEIQEEIGKLQDKIDPADKELGGEALRLVRQERITKSQKEIDQQTARLNSVDADLARIQETIAKGNSSIDAESGKRGSESVQSDLSATDNVAAVNEQVKGRLSQSRGRIFRPIVWPIAPMIKSKVSDDVLNKISLFFGIGATVIFFIGGLLIPNIIAGLQGRPDLAEVVSKGASGIAAFFFLIMEIEREIEGNGGVIISTIDWIRKQYGLKRVGLEPLLERLAADNADIREEAAQRLGILGDPRAIEPLLDRLGDKEQKVQIEAEKALKKSGATKEQIINGYISSLLRHQNWSYYEKVEGRLLKLGPTRKQLTDFYIVALTSPDYWCRERMIKKLGQVGNKRAIEPLLKELGDADAYYSFPHIDIFGYAEEALAKLGATKEQMLKGYIAAVDSDERKARRNAANRLGSLGDKSAVAPLLERSSKEKKEEVIIAIINALGRLDDQSAFAPLLRIAEDGSDKVREAVFESLIRLDTQRILKGQDRDVVRQTVKKKISEMLKHYKPREIYFSDIEKGMINYFLDGDFDVDFSPRAVFHEEEGEVMVSRDGTMYDSGAYVKTRDAWTEMVPDFRIVRKKKIPSSPAQTASSPTENKLQTSDNLGGINFTADMFDLQIKRDGNGVPLPLPEQPIQNMKIDGFLPVIMNIQPVSVPLLLGVKEDAPRDQLSSLPAKS